MASAEVGRGGEVGRGAAGNVLRGMSTTVSPTCTPQATCLCPTPIHMQPPCVRPLTVHPYALHAPHMFRPPMALPYASRPMPMCPTAHLRPVVCLAHFTACSAGHARVNYTGMHAVDMLACDGRCVTGGVKAHDAAHRLAESHPQ